MSPANKRKKIKTIFPKTTDEKIKSFISLIFVCIFIALITTPVVLLDRTTTISMLERRVLANPPRIFQTGSASSGLSNLNLTRLPREIDAYINDRFAFRSRLMTAMTWFNFKVLQQRHDDKILVGKDSWLFYIDPSLGDEFANFSKTNLFNDAQMRFFLRTINSVYDFCERHDITFIFLIVPTTSTVYPEQYPFPRSDGLSLVDQIFEAMPEPIRARTIFPLNHYLRMKEKHSQPLYYNNGLHWNSLGAYYAFELLYEKLKLDFPNLPEIEFSFTPYIDPGEDNFTMLWWGIKQFGDFLELLRVEPLNGWDNYYRYLVLNSVEENQFNTVVGYASRRGKYGVVTEHVDSTLPSAIVIRDSYFVDLQPFTSSIFSHAEYIWSQPEKRSLQYLESLPVKPDVLIWEIAERGLEAIPLMPYGVFPGS